MRGLDADNTSAIAGTVTSPQWFIEMGFDTPICLTTAETVNWAGKSFTQADISVRMGREPIIKIFNEVLALGVTVLTDGTAGRDVSIWQAYKSPGATSTLTDYAEPVLIFRGEMGAATIDDYVQIRCVMTGAQYTPRSFVSTPVFNHTPKRGSIIDMPNQRIILE